MCDKNKMNVCSFVPVASVLTSVACVVIFYTQTCPSDCAIAVPVPAATSWYAFFGALVGHFSSQHLWANVILLSTGGVLFEIIHGANAFLVVGVVGGVTGLLAEVARLDQAHVRLAGASSACFAIIGSHVAHLTMNWNETRFRVLWGVVILSYCVAELVFALEYGGERDLDVAHVAHLVGFIQGALVGILLVRNAKVLQWERVVWWSALALCLSLVWSINVLISAQNARALLLR